MKARYILFILILVIAFLSGCASTGQLNVPANRPKPNITADIKERHAILIGAWFGESPAEGGGYRKWITRRYDDGTYEVTFRLYKD